MPTAFGDTCHCNVHKRDIKKDMYFYDRQDAGRQLGSVLANKYGKEDVVVYALPRGGVVIGVEVARALHAPLDLIITRKIGHPLQPELAIAAISQNGQIVTDPKGVGGISKVWLQSAMTQEFQEAKRRREKYIGKRKPIPVKRKTAILVDDGIATGLTMKAAIFTLKEKHPSKIVVAVPISPLSTAQALEPEVNAFVGLKISEDYEFLESIGAYYQNFLPVEDNEVIMLMDNYDKEYPRFHSASHTYT